MACYFVNEIEELVMPKNEEMFDWLPSPDTWSPWVKIVGISDSPKKFTTQGIEEFLSSETALPSEIDQSSPSVCHGHRHAFHQQNAYSDEHSDVHLDDLAIIYDADDTFMHSLFETDDSDIHENECFAGCPPSSTRDRNHVQDCRNNIENVGSSPVKELKYEFCGDHSNMCEDIIEMGISEEEGVLLELQRSTLQMAEEARICFRNSLYRLAENSRHQTSCSEGGKEAELNRETNVTMPLSRLLESEANGMDTNGIDRTVATLLFNTMKFGNLSASSASDLNEEMSLEDCQDEYPHVYQPPSSSISTPQGDIVEVPTFGWMNRSLPPPYTHLSNA